MAIAISIEKCQRLGLIDQNTWMEIKARLGRARCMTQKHTQNLVRNKNPNRGILANNNHDHDNLGQCNAVLLVLMIAGVAMIF